MEPHRAYFILPLPSSISLPGFARNKSTDLLSRSNVQNYFIESKSVSSGFTGSFFKFTKNCFLYKFYIKKETNDGV